MAEDAKLLAALDLMRRMPPSRMESSLEELVDLAPDLTDDLLNTIDQPLQTAKDSKGNVYLLCDYNRDGDSYRSPWTNTYEPPLDDGILPSDTLRTMERSANDVFQSYREMYYEGGASSVYFWELDDGQSAGAFAACILFKKTVDEKARAVNQGNWDAIHVVEVRPDKPGTFSYKLTTTVMLRAETDHASAGSSGGAFDLSGSLTRQKWATFPAKGDETHIANMGRLVEDMENQLRDTVEEVYFGKTKNVVNGLYKLRGAQQEQTSAALQRGLMAEMQGKLGK